MSAGRSLAVLAFLCALAACDRNDDAPALPKIEMPALSAGAHALRLAGDPAGASGTAWVADDGKAFVQLAPESDAASSVLYTRSGSSAAWQRVPAATAPMMLAALLDDAQVSPPLAVPAGAYDSLVGAQRAVYTVGEDGRVTAGDSACKLSGQLDPAASLGGARPITLSFTGCAAANGSYRGVAYADPDAKNARFRAVLHDGSKIADFYSYAR